MFYAINCWTIANYTIAQNASASEAILGNRDIQSTETLQKLIKKGRDHVQWDIEVQNTPKSK